MISNETRTVANTRFEAWASIYAEAVVRPIFATVFLAEVGSREPGLESSEARDDIHGAQNRVHDLGSRCVRSGRIGELT